MEFPSVLAVFATLMTVTTSQQPNCPTHFGDYRDGNSCVTFLRCQNGVAYRFRCPPALPFFDQQTRRCTNQQQINCVQNNQVAGPLLGGGGRAAALGQLQQPAINQVQIAGAPGFAQQRPGLLPALPNGVNLGAPVAPANPAVPGVVGAAAVNGGQAVGGGAGVGAAVTAAGNGGAGGGFAARAGAGAGVGAGAGAGVGVLGAGAGFANQAGNGNQLPARNPALLNPFIVPGNAVVAPANPAIVAAGNPANPAAIAVANPANPAAIAVANPANPAAVAAINPIIAPNPIIIPRRRVNLAPGQQFGNAGNVIGGGFLNNPARQGQGQGQVAAQAAAGGNGGAAAATAAAAGNGVVNGNQGQPQGQGNLVVNGNGGQGQVRQGVLAGLVPALVVANQRQSASINQQQDQLVGVKPAGRH